MRVNPEGRLMTSRRSFLIGLGSIVTSTFVVRARTHARIACAPLLLAPDASEHTLFAEVFEPEGSSDGNKWRVSLGAPWQDDPPPAPTWRTYLTHRGYDVDRPEDVERLQRETDVSAKELDERLPEESWNSLWEHAESPQAKAFALLDRLGIGCGLTCRGLKAGQLAFVDGGWHPGSCERWVEVRDDLSLSLLQASLIELNRPIRIVVEGG
jgi:hypothetical protein